MNESILLNGAKDLGVNLSDFQLLNFKVFSEVLLEWNSKINLTTITDPDEISVKHFLDSMAVFSVWKFSDNDKLIDIGSGAGFPGIPIKIVKQNLKVTLLDSLLKRVRFLNYVLNELEINDVECVHERAEQMCKKVRYGMQFDVSIARAVAPLDRLCGYCLPYVKKGGAFIALKSAKILDELKAASASVAKFGGEIENVFTVPLPSVDIVRKIVVIRKIN